MKPTDVLQADIDAKTLIDAPDRSRGQDDWKPHEKSMIFGYPPRWRHDAVRVTMAITRIH
jgi:hypothetical protein